MIAGDSHSSDRRSIAHARDRALRDAKQHRQFIAEARRLANELATATTTQLIEKTFQLRQIAVRPSVSPDIDLISHAAGQVIEAVRRVLAIELFDEQLQAGYIVCHNAIAEMQTGEGKTFAVILPAYFHALAGRGVHVATPNDYLAKRDYATLKPVYKLLGITTGLVSTENHDEVATRNAYQADITYGPGQVFGFDYLRDQLSIDQNNMRPLGDRTLASFNQRPPLAKRRLRGLYAAIIDEADDVLVDDAVSPLVLSSSDNSESPDAEIYGHARDVSTSLSEGVDYRRDVSHGLRLTDIGIANIYRDQRWALDPRLARPLHEYVALALRARLEFHRDVHYVIQDDDIRIVDSSTGRIFEDRSWSEGLHQSIQCREGLKVQRENTTLARITRQRFYRSYQHLGGMTGTTIGCEPEFARVYGLPVVTVPTRLASRRVVLPENISLSQTDKLAEIAAETKSVIDNGRAVLIGTLCISESIAVSHALAEQGLSFEILNGVQDADEAAIIARAGDTGAITVATNLAGRGTDIKISKDVELSGGLHVIVSQSHSLERVDRQLIGRCARCGDPGTARLYVSAEDDLVRVQAPWIARSIVRWIASGRRGEWKLAKDLKRAQATQQRSAADLRFRLLQCDQNDERILKRRQAS